MGRLKFTFLKVNPLYFVFLLFITFHSTSLIVSSEVLSLPTINVSDISVNSGITNIKGSVTYGTIPKEEITIGLYDSTKQLISPITPNDLGEWQISDTIADKPNKLFIMAYETANSTNQTKVDVDISRPKVESVMLQYFDVMNPTTPVEFDLNQNVGSSRVIENTTIKIKVADNDVFNNYSQKTTISSPITVLSNSGIVEGAATFDPSTAIIEFVPSQYLNLSKTYYILLNSSLIPNETQSDYNVFTDDAGNAAFPILLKFTTVSAEVKNGRITPVTSSWDNNPHGYYTTNVNTCKNCHSTHVSEKAKLSNPSEDYKPMDTTLEDSYCMACHDGTTLAPRPSEFEQGIRSKHSVNPDSGHVTDAGSCTSCHNPHITWTIENPNLLKDHFVYKHNDNYEDGQVIGEVDSRVQLCEVCHGTETQIYKSRADEEAALDNAEQPYRIMHYRKSTSSKGMIQDYDLCFSCHNSTKETSDGVINIRKYYETDNDNNNANDSKHDFAALDGTQLNGFLPCAECHETHGSKNLKLLKGKYGHENQSSEEFSFTEVDNWSASKEREFCLKCHNGSTAILGVTGKALVERKGHEVGSAQKCSLCHSISGTFIEAAHSPKANQTSIP